MRLFTAIELPELARGHLANLNAHLKAVWLSQGYGWTGGRDHDAASRLSYIGPENLHVTLKFLGEVADARVPNLCEALAAVTAGAASTLFAEAAELLPPRGPVRVIAAGVGGDIGALARLHHEIENRCEELGVSAERREYRPHVTLARARNPLPSVLRDRLKELLGGRLPGPEFEAREFVLMESRLKPTGAEYVPVARFPLAGTAAGPAV